MLIKFVFGDVEVLSHHLFVVLIDDSLPLFTMSKKLCLVIVIFVGCRYGFFCYNSAKTWVLPFTFFFNSLVLERTIVITFELVSIHSEVLEVYLAYAIL